MKEIRVKNFDLRTTLECGQTFSWRKEGSGYVNTDLGQVIYVEQRENRLYYETSSDEVSLEHLFRLNDPLSKIQKDITKDELMEKAIEFAPGLRIISDPFFPCLISFICSIWKNIPAIRTITQTLRRRYGPKFKYKGREYYGFPSIEKMGKVPLDEIRSLGFGFRSQFIVRTTSALVSGLVNLESLKKIGYEEAHALLKTLHGVGDKVADCVALFSLGYLEAFPMDVWMDQVIMQNYRLFLEKGKSYAKKSEAARSYFGPYAGYAQQYLFHYIRSCTTKP
jgi:N-glycosylase/DNA lyase